MPDTAIEQFIAGIPKPQARARIFFRPGARRPSAWSPKSDWFHVCYTHALGIRPSKPIDAPIKLSLRFVLPKPAGAPRAKIWPAVRPDLDNYEKAILDAFTQAGIWTDDGRICELHSSKIYAVEGQPTGCHVYLTTL